MVVGNSPNFSHKIPMPYCVTIMMLVFLSEIFLLKGETSLPILFEFSILDRRDDDSYKADELYYTLILLKI